MLYLFRVKWRLKDIDWPTCMSHIEFVYYDTVYNESVFTHTYNGPFVDKMDFELINTQEGLHEYLFLFFMTLMGRL